jgi:hypothetical protein
MLKANMLAGALSLTLAAGSSSLLAAAVPPEEISSTALDQQSIALTIYNNNLALVKDRRLVPLASGIQHIAISDISPQMRPETALLRSISHAASFSVLEQVFHFDLLSPEKLLEKYVGKRVTLIKTNPVNGEETSEQATLLSANNGVVLKMGARIEAGPLNSLGRIVYAEIPADLRDKTTLVVTVNNKTSDKDLTQNPNRSASRGQILELSYLSTGLSWKADYVAELNANEDRMDLSARVNLSNNSGSSYRHAKLQLVAGDIQQVQVAMAQKMLRTNMEMAAADAPMAEESLLAYHMYSLDQPTNLADNQSKQVALFSATAIPVRKELLLRGADYYYQNRQTDLGSKLKASVFIEFDNKTAAKLGMPLPKGIMRLYKKDSAGDAQFVGEDSIEHTPKNALVRLKLGESFDISADKKQTDFKILPSAIKGRSAFESAYEITINNAKQEKQIVIIEEPIKGEWTITTENRPHQKMSSQLARWKIELPAAGSAKLSYRVIVKY